MDKTILGSRITQARNALHMTQQTLADGVGIDRTAIARLEAGSRKLDVSELLALSRTLDLPMAYFVSDDPVTVVNRRHDASTDDSSAWSLDASLRMYSGDVRDLQSFGLLEAPATLPEMRTPRSHEEAERAADTVRDLVDIESDPVIDLGRLCERLGLLAFVGDHRGSDGGFVVVDDSSPTLGVAVIDGGSRSGRRRMTLAHELGHWVFGDAYDHGATWDESMIFSFAIHVLAPRSAVTRDWYAHRSRPLRERVLHIGATYRLSWSAIVNQLKNLSLITETEHDELTRSTPGRGEFLRLGLTLTEELRPPYVPSGYASAVLAGYEQQLLTAERTLELLHGTLVAEDLPPVRPAQFDDITASFADHGG